MNKIDREHLEECKLSYPDELFWLLVIVAVGLAAIWLFTS
jgi:hypothetical protein